MADIDQARAFTLFRAGLSYAHIAEQMQCTEDEARETIAAAISASSVALDQSSARILALERLDALHRVMWAKAIKGDLNATDRVLRIDEQRQRLLGEPSRVKDAITDAFEKTLAELDTVAADEALIASCRQVARQIDHAVANGTSLEATKALYLLPHLWNGLRELGATPASRAALAASVPTPATTEDTGPETKEAPVDLDDFKSRRRGGTGA